MNTTEGGLLVVDLDENNFLMWFSVRVANGTLALRVIRHMKSKSFHIYPFCRFLVVAPSHLIWYLHFDFCLLF